MKFLNFQFCYDTNKEVLNSLNRKLKSNGTASKDHKWSIFVITYIEVRSRPSVHRARSSAPFFVWLFGEWWKSLRRLCPTRAFSFRLKFWLCVSVREFNLRFSAKKLPVKFLIAFFSNWRLWFCNNSYSWSKNGTDLKLSTQLVQWLI